VAFNVYDDGSIRSYLAGFCDNPATAQLLTLCLERALRKGPDGLTRLKEVPEGAPDWLRQKFGQVAIHRFQPDAALDARVRHVADWIAAAVINDEPWLRDVDAKDRPVKLMQIDSLQRAEAEADKAMRHFAFRAAARLRADGEGEESVMTFADGSRIVRLLTPEALDRESAMMGHCVGQGAYDAGLQQGSRTIYSLRDSRGRAHVTFEVRPEDNKLLQCKGRSNALPVARHMPHVAAFIERSGFTLMEATYMTGVVQDVHGRCHSILSLPENLTVAGHLDLHRTRIKSLPKGLTVDGNLHLRGTDITSLSERLTVGGNLHLEGTAITSLPEGLTVRGNVCWPIRLAITSSGPFGRSSPA
jgi:hypothetical protein